MRKEIWQICTDTFIVLLLVIISSCSFHQIEDEIASYTVSQFIYTHNINIQYSSASLSINPASRAGACTDCEYIECTIAIIIIVILVRSLFLVDIMCSFD